MAFRLGSNAANNPRAKATDAIVDSLDAGTTNPSARMLIYTGSQPATPEDPETGTLLVTLEFANPAFSAANSSGVATLAGGTAIIGTCVDTDTAGWFRIVDRDNRTILDGSCGTSGADLNFDNINFVTGGVVTVSAFEVSTPM